MFPAFIYFFLCLNTTLTGLVLRQPQTIVYYFWCIACCTALIVENRTQEHFSGVVLFILAFTISCFYTPMFDTLPLHLRAISTKILLPACVPLMMLIEVGLYFNWSENPTLVIQAFGHLSFSSSAMAFSALNNIILLTAMSAVYGFLYPSCLVMVNSRTETVQLSEEEAKILRLMDAVAKQTATKNKQEDILTTVGRLISTALTPPGGGRKSRKLGIMTASSKVAVATGEE